MNSSRENCPICKNGCFNERKEYLHGLAGHIAYNVLLLFGFFIVILPGLGVVVSASKPLGITMIIMGAVIIKIGYVLNREVRKTVCTNCGFKIK